MLYVVCNSSKESSIKGDFGMRRNIGFFIEIYYYLCMDVINIIHYYAIIILLL